MADSASDKMITGAESEELNETVVTKKNLAGAASIITERTIPDPATVQIRKNFNETAFFFPDLKTGLSRQCEIQFHHAGSHDPVEMAGAGTYQRSVVWPGNKDHHHPKRTHGAAQCTPIPA